MKTKWQAVLEVMADGRFARVGACGHKHPSEKLAEQCAERWEQADERIRNEEGLGQSAKRYFSEVIESEANNESKWDYAQVVVGEGQGTFRVYVEDGPTICENIRTEGEARTLAAAPELLAFVQMIANGGLDAGESHEVIEAEARAAIAKAERGDK